jgi:serine/threonine-protein kinase
VEWARLGWRCRRAGRGSGRRRPGRLHGSAFVFDGSAFDEALGRFVAVKVLSAEYAADAHFCAHLRAEAQAAASLNHPHVTNVYDYGESAIGGERVPYVVMELLAGPTLADRMRSGPLPVRSVLRIATQVAQALAAAHARGLVHCDIKPANVVLTSGGAKVVDFGISAVAGKHGPHDRQGQVWGTPAYIAPERLAGRSAVAATDVYALGLLLYHALSGASPWRVGSTTQMLITHAREQPAPLPPIDGLPSTVATLCGRCLAKDPRERPTAAEMARVLRAARAHLKADTPAPSVGRRSAPPGRDRTDHDTTENRPVPVALPSSPRRPSRPVATRRRPAEWTVHVLIILAAALIGGYFALGGQAAARPDPVLAQPTPGAAPTTDDEPRSGPSTSPAGPGRPTTAGDAPNAGSVVPGNEPRRNGNHSSGSGPGPRATPPATSSGAGGGGSNDHPRPVDRTVSTVGGTVVARCAGSTASIVSASPLTGFAVNDLNRGPGAQAGVTFNAILTTVRVVIRSSSGVPTASIQVS